MDIGDDTGTLGLKSPIDTRSGTAKEDQPIRMRGRTHDRITSPQGSGNGATNDPPGGFLDEKDVGILTEEFQRVRSQVIFSVNVMTNNTK